MTVNCRLTEYRASDKLTNIIRLSMQKANRGIYLIVGIFVRQIECLHGTYHAAHCHEDVLIDKFDEASLVII